MYYTSELTFPKLRNISLSSELVQTIQKVALAVLCLGVTAGVLYAALHGMSFFPSSNGAASLPPQPKFFGVNISGAEFGPSDKIGTIGTDYIYPSTANGYMGMSYFAKSGQRLIRMPFRWERMQNSPGAQLSQPDVTALKLMMSDAAKNRDMVILDLHNFGMYNQKPLQASDANNFADFWSKFAQTFKSTPSLYGYELMNEPHDLSGGCETWAILAQAGVNAIRREDMHHHILIPGNSWQSAHEWQNQSDCLAKIKDPAHKLIFSAHQYFDKDFSGTNYASSTCPTDSQYTANLIKPFLDWLNKNTARGIFTEYGVPANACWMGHLDTFMGTLKSNQRIVGGTYWSAGPWWGDYPLSVEPGANMTDKPQMSILQKYPSF